MSMYLTHSVHSTARAPQGLRASLKGLACSVAVVSGITMPIAGATSPEAQRMPIKSLANYQLTDKQYKCHNEIIYRESRFNINAIGNKSGKKQTHGYYQLKIEAIKGKPYDYQFYMYWYYVSHRYGLDHEIPDYCAALKHLQTKGWQ